MGHTCRLAQVLLACAVLLKVDDAAACHATHLQSEVWLNHTELLFVQLAGTLCMPLQNKVISCTAHAKGLSNEAVEPSKGKHFDCRLPFAGCST